jgi:hypothetical protein
MSTAQKQALSYSKPTPLNDGNIRKALVKHLQLDDPAATILHELPLARGEGKADVVYVNGKMAGFEIKSDQDSLRRLTDQCVQYDRAFDESSVVVANRHLKQVHGHVPEQWGIFVADSDCGSVVIRCLRSPKPNRRTDPHVLTRILWKTECLKLLKKEGVTVDPDTPILNLWRQIVQLPASTLRNGVIQALKQRKAAPPLSQCDD